MANYNYVTTSGVIVPDTADTKLEVLAEYQSVFGTDVAFDDSTPQGVLVNLEVEARDGVVRNNAEVANQINPAIAGGVWLDAIWALLGGQRRAATRSMLFGVSFSGVPNTLIPQGSLAEVSSSGIRFRTILPLIIGPSGSVIGDMEAVETGPIQVAINGLDSVASSVLGWETVSNPSPAIPGLDVQSDASARRARKNTLAIQGMSVSEAVTSDLYAIEGVRSLSFRENISNTTQVIDGITLLPHSIWVCVDGGSTVEIGEALHRVKTVGAAWNGSVSSLVVDTYSGQTYNVLFDRPVEIPIFLRITVRQSTYDAQKVVPEIIEDYVNGELEGDSGLFVGRDVSPWEISGAVNQVAPDMYVRSVELSTDGVNYSSAVLPIAINQVARLPSSAIQVLVVT